jgi:hypothetical protein
MIVIENTNTY